MALEPFVGPWPLLQFFNLYTDGRTRWTGDQPVSRPLSTHRRTQTQNKRTQTFMPRVWFKPTTPVFERVKTVHALARAATVIGLILIITKRKLWFPVSCHSQPLPTHSRTIQELPVSFMKTGIHMKGAYMRGKTPFLNRFIVSHVVTKFSEEYSASIIISDDGISMFLRNACNHLSQNIAPRSRTLHY
jgi:uncharacterized membrane protein